MTRTLCSRRNGPFLTLIEIGAWVSLPGFSSICSTLPHLQRMRLPVSLRSGLCLRPQLSHSTTHWASGSIWIKSSGRVATGAGVAAATGGAAGGSPAVTGFAGTLVIPLQPLQRIFFPASLLATLNSFWQDVHLNEIGIVAPVVSKW